MALPDAEQTLAALVERMRGAVAFDAKFVGIYSGGAWIELFDYGRPAVVELAVLVDRGGRELPIEATYSGARLAVARDVSIVLSRTADGRLALAAETAREGSGA